MVSGFVAIPRAPLRDPIDFVGDPSASSGAVIDFVAAWSGPFAECSGFVGGGSAARADETGSCGDETGSYGDETGL